MNNSEDITFVIIGMVITISIWAVYAFVMRNEWSLLVLHYC